MWAVMGWDTDHPTLLSLSVSIQSLWFIVNLKNKIDWTSPFSNLAFRQKRASRVSVDQLGTLVLLGLRERGVHLACQASVDQESLERRAIRGDKAFLELPEYLVSMIRDIIKMHSYSQRKVESNLGISETHTHTHCTFIHWHIVCVQQV